MSVSNQKAIPIPETVLKGQKLIQRRLREKKIQDQENCRKLAEKKVVIFKRAEQYVKEYQVREAEMNYIRRQTLLDNQFFVEPEAKVGFVIRIRGILNIPPKPRKILQLLRLRQVNNAVFVRLTYPITQMLRLIEPYIAWGYPSIKSVRDLIYKRGYASIKRQRFPITDNSIIEGALGRFGIICIEDLVYQIFTSGPHFKEVSRFMWPFKLHPPRGGFTHKLKNYTAGGDSGNRESEINQLIEAMN